jgi:hypothetical protein
MNTVVGQVAVGKDTSMATRPVGQVPSVDFRAIVVNQVDEARARKAGEKGVSWADTSVIDASQANATTM